MEEHTIYRELISLIFSDPNPDIQRIKLAVCRKYSLDVMPKNSAILAAAQPEEYETLRRVLMVKPTRTLSGGAPVAVMTSPCACPHGKCLPCPGGPDHIFKSPQSYTGEEPAALRARQNEYDPYRQVTARLGQFKLLGHHVDKAELIVMGGTMTARDAEYQEWFVSECLRAMNEFSGKKSTAGSVEELMLENEKADVRCIATTFETRPDWCRKEHINKMLELGVTKVELGFQHTDDELLRLNKRGHTVADSVLANTLLRDAGIKVGFHVMPNLYGSTIPRDREMIDTLFTDTRFFRRMSDSCVSSWIFRQNSSSPFRSMGTSVSWLLKDSKGREGAASVYGAGRSDAGQAPPWMRRRPSFIPAAEGQSISFRLPPENH